MTSLRDELKKDTEQAMKKLKRIQEIIREVCAEGEFGRDYEGELSDISQSIDFLVGRARLRLDSLGRDVF